MDRALDNEIWREQVPENHTICYGCMRLIPINQVHECNGKIPRNSTKSILNKNLDEINKPEHYHKGGIDVIGFAELHYSKEELKGFYRINCIKYIDRYDKKGGVSSLKKCEFYLKKLIELEEK